MAISINHATYVISIPKADTAFVSTNATTGYEVRSYDEYDLMRELADYLDSEAGIALPSAFTHATQVTISGVVYARSLLFLAPYTITFETGAYQVNLIGGTNNNMLDVLNPNNVSVIPANSAGLQIVTATGGGTTEPTIGEPLLYRTDNSTTMADPGVGEVRWDNSPKTSATQIAIDTTTDDGIDVSAFVGRLSSGDLLRIQDKDDATKYQNWVVNTITANVGWVLLDVTLSSSGGSNLPNNHPIVLVFSYPAGAASDPWTTALPGAYGAGTAGNILGTMLASIGARMIEGTLTQDQITRIMLGALAGERVGLGTATERYKSQDGTKDRIVLTPDVNGNGDPTVDGS